jgi:hypothetical protein
MVALQILKIFCILNNTCYKDFSVYGDVHVLIGGDTHTEIAIIKGSI